MSQYTTSQTKLLPLLRSLLLLALLASIVSLLKSLGFGITYAVSYSVPNGWYLLIPATTIKRYNIVQFKPPEATVTFLQKLHWAPKNALLVKYVYGLPGDFVCNKNASIWINNKLLGPIYNADKHGNALPKTNFCGKLPPEQYILLSTHINNSFDSRYFGPINRANIKSKAIPL
jgi:conjugative transfer signal peptidase TraF